MTRNKRIASLLLVIGVAITACNLPSGVPTEDASPTFTPLALESETPTATIAAVTEACSPTLTTNTDANVRGGPGQVYNILGVLPQGASATVAGKNSEGTWWYIEFAAGNGGYAWIAGSVTTATCIPNTLPVIAAPPTPIIPTDTPTNTPLPPSPTPTFGLIIIDPVFPLFPIAFGDIVIQDVFLSTSGEIVVRVAVDPVSSLSGSFQYKVWVNGGSATTKTATLPSGSAAFYSGKTLSNSLFNPNDVVKVRVDTADAFAETDETNNEWNGTCSTQTSPSCN